MYIPLEILKLDKGYQVLCRCFINNKEYRLLVDSGASQTMFDTLRLKRKINDLTIENESHSTSLGGVIKNETVKIDIKFGNKIILDFEILLIDFETFNKVYLTNGLPEIDGLLGSDFLVNYNGVIDFKNRKLLFD